MRKLAYAAPAKTPSPMFEADTCSKTGPKTASPPVLSRYLQENTSENCKLPTQPIATTHGSAASRYLELARPRTRVVAGGGRICRRRCNQIATLVNVLKDTIKPRGGKTPADQHFT